MGNLNFKFRNLLFTFYLLSPLKLQIGAFIMKIIMCTSRNYGTPDRVIDIIPNFLSLDFIR